MVAPNVITRQDNRSFHPGNGTRRPWRGPVDAPIPQFPQRWAQEAASVESVQEHRSERSNYETPLLYPVTPVSSSPSVTSPRQEALPIPYGSHVHSGLYRYDGPSATNTRSIFHLNDNREPFTIQSLDSETRRQGNEVFQKGTLTSPIHHIQGSFQDATEAVVETITRTATSKARYEELEVMYEEAKDRGENLQRRGFGRILFEYTIYLVILSFIYFALVGIPLWKGGVYYMYKFLSKHLVLRYGYTIFIGIATIYAFLPLLTCFEKYPKAALPLDDPRVRQTALIIPCYKSAGLIENTIKAALKIFPSKNIFVIANGNSPEPIDNTAEIISPYGVNHVWSPVGSKIVAQFVGCYAAEKFKYVLLIDDDCTLPPNFPVVTGRLKGNIKCLGYILKSVGPNSSRGTLCQQAQDLEYKLSGMQRAISGKIGSVTFAHGAIALWDREFLIKTFHEHPSFSVSEDWFFGHIARKLGSRITMCTSVFVETQTPSAVFFSSGGLRGGFGKNFDLSHMRISFTGI